MRKILARHLRPGMVLAKTVYNADGRVLLSEGKVMRGSYIERLVALGVHHVFIVDARLTDIQTRDVLSHETRRKAWGTLSSLSDQVESGRGMNIGSLKTVVNDILNDILTNDSMLSNLLDIQVLDDYTLGHSINVCVLSIMTAIGMNVSRKELTEIGIGAILHDIGKISVPLQILNKPGRLTNEEYDVIKKHTDRGFAALRDNPEISLLSAHVAFQHHERYDGAGYPRGLSGEEIHSYARIVAVADVYDALSSNRTYRDAYLPHQALELIMSGVGSQFFHEDVTAFLKNVPLYPVGTIVKLNDGRVGAVVKVNRGLVGRPILRILYNSKGEILKEPYELNLGRETTLIISEVITDDSFFVN